MAGTHRHEFLLGNVAHGNHPTGPSKAAWPYGMPRCCSSTTLSSGLPLPLCLTARRRQATATLGRRDKKQLGHSQLAVGVVAICGRPENLLDQSLKSPQGFFYFGGISESLSTGGLKEVQKAGCFTMNKKISISSNHSDFQYSGKHRQNLRQQIELTHLSSTP